jgi:2-octaprenyl-6-methoxyphenol hydroxylase
MVRDFDIVIAGGGLNGSALALALASVGCQVALVDPVPVASRRAPDFDGRGYALSISSIEVLKALGLWGALKDQAQPIRDIKISDGSLTRGPSPFGLEFASAEIEEGPMGHMVEDRHLQAALQDAITADPRITHRTETSLSGHEAGPSGVAVTLSDGTALGAALLVGCDGRTSPTARRAGIKHRGTTYGQTSLVCAIDHAEPHHGCAHQYFLPSGPLAVLPLPGDRSSIVWTEKSNIATTIQNADDKGYRDALALRLGNRLGSFELVGKRFAYPLSMSLADRFYADRVALVGDAAHAVHPIAGQGLNAGLKDVAALAEVVADARRRGDDIGSEIVLSEYQRWRRFDATTLALATDGFNRLFSNDNPILRLGRGLGMSLVNAVPAMRRGLVREAAGLTGDLPRLCRGLPLD